MLSSEGVKFKRIFEAAQDGILILDYKTGEITDSNPFLEKILGYSKQELLHKKLWEVGTFKDIAEAKSDFIKLKRKRYIRYKNKPLIQKNGVLLHVEFISHVYEYGHTKVIQCNIRNITNQIVAEKKLASSEIKFRRLFEAAQDGILILDYKTGEITDSNPFLEKMLCYSKKELLHKKLWEIGTFKDIANSQSDFARLKKRRYIRYKNKPLSKKNGGLVYVEFVSNVYEYDHTKVIQCNIRDITDQVIAEEKLKSSEVKFRRLFETAQDGILIVNFNTGEVTDANSSFKKMIQCSQKELLHKKLWELEAFKSVMNSLSDFNKFKKVWHIPYSAKPLRKKNGDIFYVEFVSKVYQYDHTKVFQFNARDVTEKVFAQQKLQNEAKRQVALKEIIEEFSRPFPIKDTEIFAYVLSYVRVLIGSGRACLYLFPCGKVKDPKIYMSRSEKIAAFSKKELGAFAGIVQGKGKRKIVGNGCIAIELDLNNLDRKSKNRPGKSSKLKFFIFVLIRLKGEEVGFIGFEFDAGEKYAATLKSLSFLGSLSGLVSNFLLRVESEKNFEKLATLDHLTHLPNRMSFETHVGNLIKQSKKHKTKFAMLFVDIDRFKQVNDKYGHAVGDRVLRGVANCLRSAVRTTDFIARMGGDEFIVIISRLTNVKQANAFASKISHQLSQDFSMPDHKVPVTVSVGVSVFPADGKTLKTLYRKADDAMYSVKSKKYHCKKSKKFLELKP